MNLMAKTFKNICETFIIGPDCQERFLPVSSEVYAYLAQRGISLSGLSILSGQYEIGRIRPAFHHLLYCIRGSGWVVLPDRETTLNPGEIYIAPAGIASAYGIKSKRWEIAWLMLLDIEQWSMVYQIGPGVRRSTWSLPVRNIMEGILTETAHPGKFTGPALQNYYDLLLMHLRRELDVQAGQMEFGIAEKLQLLQEKVRARIHYPWTVAELLEQSELYVSENHFHRLCLEHWQSPPLKKVTAIRMERARELLLNTDYSVHLIGELVGYQNAFAFSTAFNRWSGSSPRQCRNAGKTWHEL